MPPKKKVAKRFGLLDMGIILAVCAALCFLARKVLADDGADVPASDFFSAILELIKSFGGMSWAVKIATVVALIISSMKVSFLRPLWEKLGKGKAVLAPLLGLIAGVLSLSSSGQLTLSGVLAYMFVGAGALMVHELLDLLKGIPGLGALWVGLIDLIMKIPAVGADAKK